MLTRLCDECQSKQVDLVRDEMPSFPVNWYDSAQDMIKHRASLKQPITEEDYNDILAYAAELEQLIEKLEV